MKYSIGEATLHPKVRTKDLEALHILDYKPICHIDMIVRKANHFLKFSLVFIVSREEKKVTFIYKTINRSILYYASVNNYINLTFIDKN